MNCKINIKYDQQILFSIQINAFKLLLYSHHYLETLIRLFIYY